MELSDEVQITLTKEGAEYLINRNKEFRKIAEKYASFFPGERMEEHYPLNYHDRQVLVMTLKTVFITFGSAIERGAIVPFTNLVPVDKRCSSRKGARSCRVS